MISQNLIILDSRRIKDKSPTLETERTQFQSIKQNEDKDISKEEIKNSLLTSKSQIRTLNNGRNVKIVNTTKACQIQ